MGYKNKPMNIDKETLKTFVNNGYSFSYFEKGFYYFQKNLQKGGFLIGKFKESDFYNGNFIFCTDNDISRN